ncbi:hypothetical protein COOONC_09303 [Cooperia oncophora]
MARDTRGEAPPHISVWNRRKICLPCIQTLPIRWKSRFRHWIAKTLGRSLCTAKWSKRDYYCGISTPENQWYRQS